MELSSGICADVVITPEVRYHLHRPQGGNVREAGLHVCWRDSEERRRRRSCEARVQDTGFALSVGLANGHKVLRNSMDK